MPLCFVASTWVFIPKGFVEDSRDEFIVVVRPGETRPLALKNSDNKLVCSCWLRKLRAAVSVHACPLQRGFIPGRTFVQNVVDLDAAARQFGLQMGAAKLPSLACFDFAAAFPSLSHSWLFRLLAHLKLPEGFVNLVKAVYHCNTAFGRVLGALAPIFLVMCGVLQGCHLSGVLFAWCIGAGVAQWAAIDPGAVHASGGQELGEEGQLCIRCGAGAMVPLHVNSPARRIHHHGLQCLRLDSKLTPFCFTHLVTPINPLKLAPSLACSRFRSCQLPEIGLSGCC